MIQEGREGRILCFLENLNKEERVPAAIDDPLTGLAEYRVMRFLTEAPVYVGCSTDVVERIVAGIAESRNEVILFETVVERLLADGQIEIGEPEPDDLNADPRSMSRSGQLTRRLSWKS